MSNLPERMLMRAHADGANLKREREALGFSQAELGRKLSVSSNTIARWERGELKIEHPAMLQLAMATLRRNLQQVHRVAVPPLEGQTFRSTGKRRTARNSVAGQLTSLKSKSRTSSDAGRVKKK
jgi:transcriptional regulator with XRE-family HTH domain